jgi:hypothetical protein
MKKIIRTLGLACMAGLFAVTVSSCKKSQDNTTKVELTMGEIEDIYPGNERAYINTTNGYTYWNKNDQVRAYNLNVANDPNAYLNSTTAIIQCGNAAEDKPYANFYGPSLGTMQSDYYHFFYPVNMVNGVLGPYNVDTFMIANTQAYTEKVYKGNHYATIDPLAMPLASRHTATTGFIMNHVFGYLRLWVTGEGHVTSVVLTDPNHHLTGYATMRMDKVDPGQLGALMDHVAAYEDADAQQILLDYVYNPDQLNLQTYPQGNIITMECDDEIELDTRVASGFVFAVRPGALWWQNGVQEPFTVTFNFSDRAPVTISAIDFLNGSFDTRMLVSRSGWCKNVNAYVGLINP